MPQNLTPREIVKRCVNFQDAPRLAFKLSFPWQKDLRSVRRGKAPNRETAGWHESTNTENFMEIIDDWVDVGVNVCMFDQPELHDIDYLAEKYRGRMAFCSPVDIQRTLQTRDRNKIESAAREYIDKLGAMGGFIPDYYGDNKALALDPEIQAYACRAFTRCGDPDNTLNLPEELR